MLYPELSEHKKYCWSTISYFYIFPNENTHTVEGAFSCSHKHWSTTFLTFACTNVYFHGTILYSPCTNVYAQSLFVSLIVHIVQYSTNVPLLRLLCILKYLEVISKYKYCRYLLLKYTFVRFCNIHYCQGKLFLNTWSRRFFPCI